MVQQQRPLHPQVRIGQIYPNATVIERYFGIEYAIITKFMLNVYRGQINRATSSQETDPKVVA